MLYPVADDSDDPDWLLRGMQEKGKRKTDEPMSEFLSNDDALHRLV